MSQATNTIDARSVKATMNYIGPMSEEPYMYYREPPPGQPYTNVNDEPHRIAITDVRGNINRFNLEHDGMQFFRHGHSFSEFEDDNAIRSDYYRVVEDMFLKRLGAERVIAYDFSVRRPAHGLARPDGVPVSGTRRRPIKRAHGDFMPQSFEAFLARFSETLGEDLSKKRCRAFNFWRAIAGPLTDGPLALCHPSTVTPEDMVPMKQYNDPQDNYIAALRYNPEHRWYFCSDMEGDEGMMFSSFDNALPRNRGVVMHGAFDDPGQPADGLPRHSMEVRVLVVGG